MINEKTRILEIPYNLVTLSKATGNPMIDLGYQCSDMRPFFKYQNGNVVYYTNVNPKLGFLQNISVYEKYIKNIDGVNYDAMRYIGITTATTASTITFNDIIYTYSNTYENIRMFYINKWARYKPIAKIGDYRELTLDQRLGSNGGLTVKNISTTLSPYDKTEDVETILNELSNGSFYWTYNPPVPNEDWMRMTDFEGYYPLAESPFFLEFETAPHLIENGCNIFYYNPGINNITTGNIKIHLGAKSAGIATSPNLNWYDFNEVFKDITAQGEEVLDFTNLTDAQMQMLANRYDDMGYGLALFDGKEYKMVANRSQDKATPFYPVLQYVPENSAEGIASYLQQSQIIEVPVTAKNTCVVGGVIDNLYQGKGLFYLPCNPLKFRLEPIPDLLHFSLNDIEATGHDLIVSVTVVRNGNNYWWGVRNPDITVKEIQIIKNESESVDWGVYLQSYKLSNRNDVQSMYTSEGARKIIYNGNDVEWNGCRNTHGGGSSGGLAPIGTPIAAVPNIMNSDSFKLVFELGGVKESPYFSDLQNGERKFSEPELMIFMNVVTNGHGTIKEKITLTITEDMFKTIGW